jgi:ribosomal protein S18 acetylase RimI-like enzyme
MKNKMIFREIGSKDIQDLFEIRLSTEENQVTFEYLAGIGITPKSIADGLAGPLKGWLCEVSEEVVGFSLGNKETGEMMVVAVLPEYENMGIGKKLMELIQDWFWSCGHDEIWLLATADPELRASGFYKKLGWEKAGTSDDGHQILRLHRNKS